MMFFVFMRVLKKRMLEFFAVSTLLFFEVGVAWSEGIYDLEMAVDDYGKVLLIEKASLKCSSKPPPGNPYLFWETEVVGGKPLDSLLETRKNGVRQIFELEHRESRGREIASYTVLTPEELKKVPETDLPLDLRQELLDEFANTCGLDGYNVYESKFLVIGNIRPIGNSEAQVYWYVKPSNLNFSEYNITLRLPEGAKPSNIFAEIVKNNKKLSRPSNKIRVDLNEKTKEIYFKLASPLPEGSGIFVSANFSDEVIKDVDNDSWFGMLDEFWLLLILSPLLVFSLWQLLVFIRMILRRFRGSGSGNLK